MQYFSRDFVYIDSGKFRKKIPRNQEKGKIMKKVFMCLAAFAVFCTTGVFAMSSDCPENAKCPEKVCEKGQKKDFKKQRQMKKHHNRNAERNAVKNRRPRFKMSPEAKAEMEKFRAAVKDYKANQTPENKAKLVEILNKHFDKRMEMGKKQVAAMRDAADKIEKKNAEMLKNRDAEIEKMLERIMNPPKRPARKAPAKQAPKAKIAE